MILVAFPRLRTVPASVLAFPVRVPLLGDFRTQLRVSKMFWERDLPAWTLAIRWGAGARRCLRAAVTEPVT